MADVDAPAVVSVSVDVLDCRAADGAIPLRDASGAAPPRWRRGVVIEFDATDATDATAEDLGAWAADAADASCDGNPPCTLCAAGADDDVAVVGEGSVTEEARLFLRRTAFPPLPVRPSAPLGALPIDDALPAPVVVVVRYRRLNESVPSARAPAADTGAHYVGSAAANDDGPAADITAARRRFRAACPHIVGAVEAGAPYRVVDSPKELACVTALVEAVYEHVINVPAPDTALVLSFFDDNVTELFESMQARYGVHVV